MQLLMRVRRPFGLSLKMHLACFAEATFVTHRRNPNLVDLAVRTLTLSLTLTLTCNNAKASAKH